jgi:hypothetical protein
MQIRTILEVRYESGAIKHVHGAESYHFCGVSELLIAIEKSKAEALAELPRWLPSPERSLSNTPGA